MSDVKDILEIEQTSAGAPTKESIVAGTKVKLIVYDFISVSVE